MEEKHRIQTESDSVNRRKHVKHTHEEASGTIKLNGKKAKRNKQKEQTHP